MSDNLDRLDKCTDAEKHNMLCWISGYDPGVFRLAMDRTESHRKPPRIDEPGPWGVVEAACDAFERRVKWVHGDPTEFGNDWHTFGGGDDPYHRVWSDLIDPVLVREGVES